MDLLTNKDGKAIPFTEHGDANDLNANKGRRVRIVKEFIGGDLSGLHTLDIGPPNAFGKILGIKDNTKGDVNEGLVAPSYAYDLILCSEIFEHLMAPLWTMRNIYYLLRPNGVCILSTPLANPFAWYQSYAHFAEYKPDRLRRLFEYVGFEVVKMKIYCIWDWWPFMFTGIRPFLRCLFHRSQLWYLRKARQHL